MVNEAALLAARHNRKAVLMFDFEVAKDKVLMGVERKSLVVSAKERRITAYHEAGHALVAKLLPGTDPIHKVTIIPRGRALGVTQQLPTEDKHNYSKEFLLNDIAILYGGRVAEEIVFGEPEITTGAMNDIERATELARKMVCEWGMSETMGPLQFGKREEMVFLGREIAQHQDYSEHTAMEIDREVRRIVMDNYERAKGLVQRRLETLRHLAEALLEREVLDGPEIDVIVRGAGSPAPAAAA
jgi:cell division protease FtsH